MDRVVKYSNKKGTGSNDSNTTWAIARCQLFKKIIIRLGNTMYNSNDGNWDSNFSREISVTKSYLIASIFKILESLNILKIVGWMKPIKTLTIRFFDLNVIPVRTQVQSTTAERLK